MILANKSRGLELDVPDELSEGYDTSNEEDPDDLLNEQVDENRDSFLPSLGHNVNNYLNNLNLNFNLNFNDRLNAFEASLWNFYEKTQFPQFPPVIRRSSTQVISNLWNQLVDEESEAQLKHLHFQKIQQKAAAEVRRRLEPKIIHSNSNPLRTSEESYPNSETNDSDNNIFSDCVATVEGDGVQTLDQEFWSQFFGFKTEGEERTENAGPEVATPTNNSQPKPPLNPFYSRVHLSMYDKIKSGVMSVVVLPFRLVGFLICILLACSISKIGTLGLTQEQLREKPLAKWRRVLRWIVAHVAMRSLYFFGGFHWVKKIGKQASAKEAPVIVVAPHSSYLDAFIVILLGGPSVVAKEGARHVPFFGKLIDFTQPIYVKREDPTSRQTSVKEITRRAQSSEDWPPVLIFPEGTCSNRSALIQFKAGAFVAGVPVQPVIIRYPNRLDAPTWTFDSPSVYLSIWLTLTQIHNHIEIEFLPVYVPSEDERQNVKLYVRNVQRVMAESLGIPASDFTFEDGMVLAKIRETQIRNKLETIWRIKGDLNLRESPTETTLVYEGTTSQEFEWRITLSRFQDIFHIQTQTSSPEVEELFNLFKEGEKTEIDLRAYLLLVCFMYSDVKLDLLMTLMFKMYAGKKNVMNREYFVEFMTNVFESEEKEAIDLFNAGYDPNRTALAFEEFRVKIARRVEYIKMYAMEATGQRSGNFPRRDERDLDSTHFKSKTN